MILALRPLVHLVPLKPYQMKIVLMKEKLMKNKVLAAILDDVGRGS